MTGIIFYNWQGKKASIMKRLFVALFAFSAAAGLNACNNNGNSQDAKDLADSANEQKFDSTHLEEDAEWAVDAAGGGMMEVRLGELAQKNAASADVKEFGKMMVDDHSKANEALKSLAARKNITLPETLGEDAQKKYDELSKKTGADFDKAYISLMVDDHQEDIEEFKEEAAKGRDADLKLWASEQIATLEHHLDAAKTIKDALK